MAHSESSRYHIRKNLITGLTLICVGSIFLLDRLDVLEVRQFWHLWPVFFALFGINKMINAEKSSQFVDGGFEVVLAFWLYASIEHLWGWSFSTSWPFLLIGYGLSVILSGFIKNQKQ
jgi:hypothetical protein